MKTVKVSIPPDLVAVWSFMAWIWDKAQKSEEENFPFKQYPQFTLAGPLLICEITEQLCVEWEDYISKHQEQTYLRVLDTILAHQKEIQEA